MQPSKPNDPMPPPGPEPLEDHPPFRDWAAFIKLRGEAGRLFEGRTVEAQKVSAEYGKIIVTNLHLINGGALLAVPTLSESLLGFKNLDRCGKLFYLGIPMTMLGVGLLCASMCAFFAYLNWGAVARHSDAERRILEALVENVNPRLGPAQPAMTSATVAACQQQQGSETSAIKRNFWLSFAAGWASLILFVSACAFLAFNLR